MKATTDTCLSLNITEDVVDLSIMLYIIFIETVCNVNNVLDYELVGL